MAPVRVQGNLHYSRTWQSIIPLHIAEAQTDIEKAEQRILTSAAYLRQLQVCNAAWLVYCLALSCAVEPSMIL